MASIFDDFQTRVTSGVTTVTSTVTKTANEAAKDAAAAVLPVHFQWG